MISEKNGVSALGLQRELGLKRYETAWEMLQNLRRAMVRPGRESLAGEVEVDETYVGGAKPGKRGRGAEGKQLVAIAAEKNGKKIGRIRMQRISSAEAKELEGFVRIHIQETSVVETDGWRGYLGLTRLGYRHRRIKGEAVGIDELMPRIHLVASLLKRWLLGTHQGRVERDHLDAYLDEFTFRFNRRSSRSRGKLFRRLLEQAMQQDGR
jgi:transposase-like protein